MGQMFREKVLALKRQLLADEREKMTDQQKSLLDSAYVNGAPGNDSVEQAYDLCQRTNARNKLEKVPETEPWEMCGKCAHSMPIGGPCPNPNCDNGWLT